MAMMACSNEETAPSEPGFCNEGGCVWDERFDSINPQYFDSADRRFEYVVNAGLAPVLFGAWHQALKQMGLAKMKKYWRYLIARYGAYPVFWVAGGEIYGPPGENVKYAGFAYGNAITGESYSADKPLHRIKLSLSTWDKR